MAFNINEIQAQLTGGGARNSHFQVQIQNPVEGAGDLKIPFMVKASVLPADNLGVIEVPYFGRKIKQPGDRVFDEWEVIVINDEDFAVRNGFEAWMSAINSHEENLRQFADSSPLNVKSQAQVNQYSKTGQLIRTYNFNGLWPSFISPIDLSWENTDQIQEFSVTFQYDWWNVSGGTTGDGGTQ